MQNNRARVLWYSFFAILSISIAYLFVINQLGGIPPASEFFGHSIGIIGFVLMLMTETLYSIRKRSRAARWGRMSAWLNFHIFTGLVGPFLVLLHSSWKFNGLAGITMLLTVIIVLSGFVGRYIYTSIPRTADGIAIESAELERAIQTMDQDLNVWLSNHPPEFQQAVYQMTHPLDQYKPEALGVLTRTVDDWRARRRSRTMLRRLGPQARPQLSELERLLAQRRRFARQKHSLASARRLMSLWHAVHIPIGMVLFTAAFIHIGAAIYYATLLK